MTDGARVVSNEEFFARLFGQRLIHFLTTRNSAYFFTRWTMRLRLEKRQVRPLSGRASRRVPNVPQHSMPDLGYQALVRARAVAGEPRLRTAFEEVRARYRAGCATSAAAHRGARDAPENGREPRRRCCRIQRQAQPGGIVDIERRVQYAVLRWAYAHPVLARHTDNIGILEALAAEALPTGARARTLIEAYRRYLSAGAPPQS